MGYPGLPINAAREIDERRRDGDGSSLDARSSTIWKLGADFDESIATDCLNQCCDLIEMMENDGASYAEFDSRCAPLVHMTLALPMRVAGDSDFWTWLTFTQGCYGAEIVDRRYGRGRRKADARPARPVYYGLEVMKKGMFAKLWICANMMYVRGATNPYDGIEYADVDLWDSHVIDVDYGSAPAMARAFVKVVRDLALARGSPNAPDQPTGYRDLAKEIRRRHATVAFELFDDATAYRFVKEVWNERESWCRR